MRIVWIGECPETVPRLARWHVDAFAAVLEDWHVEHAAFELRTHVARRAVPTTLVALEEREPLGSVSLLESDLPAPDRYAPWLGSLFVRPDARGRGIGSALVRAAVAEAAALGLSCLHLWTPGQADFYRRLGWESLGMQRFDTVEACLMRFDCLPGA